MALSNGERAEPRGVHFRNVAKKFSMAAALIAFGSIVQAQSTPDKAEQTIQTCLTSEFSADSLSSSLSLLGWQRVANADLTEEHLHNWAAIRLIQSMAFGKASAVRWQAAWELALKGAGGVRRLVPIEDSQSLQFFFEHAEMNGFLEAGVQTYPAGAHLSCEFVVLPVLAEKSLQPLHQNLLNDSMPPVVFLKPQQFDTAGIKRQLNMSLLKNDEISQLTETDFPYIAHVSTGQSMKNVVPQ
ncbi:MAG: hypothetical protein R8G34_19845 [Paracoccaceae bacterium]|nr:hypothetical protein [Paracoccaceae bacterium]